VHVYIYKCYEATCIPYVTHQNNSPNHGRIRHTLLATKTISFFNTLPSPPKGKEYSTGMIDLAVFLASHFTVLHWQFFINAMK